jgi:hypothetical protein
MDIHGMLTDVLARFDWRTILLVAVPLALLTFAVVTAILPRPDRRVTLLATVIGLGWSAQGMWDTAVHTYHVVPQLAVVLFTLFEAFMIGRMLNANLYRHDRDRRARPVRFVWSLAFIMGTVVALAEGWHQAPLRFVVPPLVACNWWIDLTADDDVASAGRTSWRWTPRRLGLAIGAIQPGAKDAKTIDRDTHVARMRDLAFRVKTGHPVINEILRRKTRLARREVAADDEMIAEVRAALARRGAILRDTQPSAQPTRKLPERSPILITPARRVQGVHEIDGKQLRGDELAADAVARMRASVSPDRPRGMTIADLADLYTPPLKQRTAETFAAEARRQQDERVNGNTPSI